MLRINKNDIRIKVGIKLYIVLKNEIGKKARTKMKQMEVNERKERIRIKDEKKKESYQLSIGEGMAEVEKKEAKDGEGRRRESCLS